jgi:hypothetical protein
MKITVKREVLETINIPDSEFLKMRNRYYRIMPDNTVIEVHDIDLGMIEDWGIYPSIERKNLKGAFGWMTDLVEIVPISGEEFNRAIKRTLDRIMI